MFDDYLLFTLLQGYEKDHIEEDDENEEIDNGNEEDEAECGKENDEEKNNGCANNDELKNFEHLINIAHDNPEKDGGVFKCIFGGGGFR